MYLFVDPGPPKWLGWLCHQLPERSFFIKGRQCWVCARCQGFYYFFAIGLVLPFIFNAIFALPDPLVIGSVILSIIPMGIDGMTQYFGLRESSNWLRFITGAICGFFIGIGLIFIIIQSFFS